MSEKTETQPESVRKYWWPLILVIGVIVFGGVWFAKSQAQQPHFQSFPELFYVTDSKKHSQALDLWVPTDRSKPVPVIVWIHGGGWAKGDKAEIGGLADFITGERFALASVNYRLTDEAIWPAQIYDCKAAIRWLRANAKQYNIDPERIGVWGCSAGGHLVALLGTSEKVAALEGDEGNAGVSSGVQAVCDWCGPTNLLKVTEESAPDNPIKPKDPHGVLALFLGGLPKDKPREAKAADPDTYISKSAPPFLIMHGDKDNVVPIEQSRELYKNLQEAGVPSGMIIVKGGDHSFGNVDTIKQAIAFFADKLHNTDYKAP